MSPVEVKEGRDGKEMGINRESGLERAAALSRTVRHRVLPELAQPPRQYGVQGAAHSFACLAGLVVKAFPLAEFLALGESVTLCPELPQKRQS